MKAPRIFLVCLVLVFLVSCALPREERKSSFVNETEMGAVRLSRLGMAQLARGQLSEAELSFRQALYLYPSLPNLKQNLAVALAKQGQVEEAQAIFNELSRQASDPTALLLAQGDMFYYQSEFARAKGYYLSALSAAEKHGKSDDAARINRSLAVLSFKAGKEEEALCYSQQAFSLRPGNMDEAYRHIRLLIALNQFSTAAGQIAKIAAPATPEVSHAPLTEPRLLYLKGLSAFAGENYALALKDATSSLELGAGDFGLEAEASLLGSLARRQLGVAADQQPESEEGSRLAASSLLYLPPVLLDSLERKM